jgi:Transglutaminase-like superfamily
MEYVTSRITLHFDVFLLMVSVRRRLRPMGLEKTIRWAASGKRSTPADRHPRDRTVRAVQRVGRWLVPGASCLVQSITLMSMFQRQGSNAELIIGCGRQANKWAAHAWVESGGNSYQPVFADSQTELARCNADRDWRLVRALPAG